MQVLSVDISNFQMLKAVKLDITAQVLLVAAKNEQGKSSLQEAIKYAFTGEPTRVSRKKDLHALVRDGASRGHIAVKWDNGSGTISLPKGDYKRTGGDLNPAIPLLLDASQFAKSTPDQRREIILSLTGAKMSSDAIANKLIERACEKTKVEAIAPILWGGFQPGHEEAKRRASEARGAWKATTGETYGSVKAATWTAHVPAFSDQMIEQTKAEIVSIRQKLADDTQHLCAMKLAISEASRTEGIVNGLRQTASQYARIEAKLRHDEAELKKWEGVHAELSSKAGVRQKDEPTYCCPACSVVLRHDPTDGHLVEFLPQPPISTETKEALETSEKAVHMMLKSVENDIRDLKNADEAAKKLDAIAETAVKDPPNSGTVDTVEARVAETRKTLAKLQSDVVAAESAKAKAMQAGEKTAKAAKFHIDVTLWESIAEALEPGGIQIELIGEALIPMNQRLHVNATNSGWDRVTIDTEMEICLGGRPYGLCSESAKYRADLMIAEAIGTVSGLRFFVADRLDVLEASTHRLTALKWLHMLALSDELDQAIISGTFRSEPKTPSTFDVVWLENGEIVKPATASV